MENFHYCSIGYINREGNNVADRLANSVDDILAHFANRGHSIELRLNEEPAPVRVVLLEDLFFVSSDQGLGITAILMGQRIINNNLGVRMSLPT